jgi:hypothetical protein
MFVIYTGPAFTPAAPGRHLRDARATRFIIWDFPFGFLPATSVGLFRDSLPSPQICNSIFQSALVFPLGQGVFRCLILYKRANDDCRWLAVQRRRPNLLFEEYMPP